MELPWVGREEAREQGRKAWQLCRVKEEFREEKLVH